LTPVKPKLEKVSKKIDETRENHGDLRFVRNRDCESDFAETEMRNQNNNCATEPFGI